jgi:hypothetical protein
MRFVAGADFAAREVAATATSARRTVGQQIAHPLRKPSTVAAHRISEEA